MIRSYFKNIPFKSHYFFSFLIFQLFFSIVFAQSINFKYGEFDLTNSYEDFLKEEPFEPSLNQTNYYKIVRFSSIPKRETRRELESKGILFIDYISQNAYTVSIPYNFLKSNFVGYDITHIQDIPKILRFDPAIFESPIPQWADKGDKINLEVILMKNYELNFFLEYLDALGSTIIDINSTANIVRCELPKNKLMELSEIQYVNFISFISAPGEPEDTGGRSLHRSNSINTQLYNGRKYDASGVSVCVNDDGFVGPHIDFKGRTEQSTVANDLNGDHGDMVAGILGGAGNLNPQYEGMAKGAKIHVRQYSSSLPNSVQLNNDSNVMIFSSSYGNSCNAGYTSLCYQIDREIVLNPSLIQVFSCGNSGNSNCGYGAGSGWGNITGGHKQAKNVIATANLNFNGTLVSSSSRGPASDGRIKPDIAAHGNGQISTDPNNIYNAGSGTSAAAPGISGVLAQLYQAYRELNSGLDPESGLLKACLLNTAQDYGNTGPDFSYGWGIVNALKAVKVLEENRYQDSLIDNGESHTINFTVPEGTKEARIMLYWMDPERSPSSSISLLNDLDLKISNNNGDFYPWVLDPTPNSSLLSLPATTGEDHLNNMEQVTIFDPVSGNYSAEISGFNVPIGPQKYYILYEFISDEIIVTYPIGGEGVVPYRSEFIQWDTYGSIGSFDVEFSIDNGLSWTSIGNQVNGSIRLKQWQVPNSVSGQALVRVSRGGISGQSSDVFSIIDYPKNININNVCECEFSISWNEVPFAAKYEISVLGEKYMDSIGSTTETSYNIPIDNPNDEVWFSVRAITENGTKGVRAVAEYYDGSGVSNCLLNSNFYTNKSQLCTDFPVNLFDQTIGCPISWDWSFIPSTVTYLENTNSNSPNPVVSFENDGLYQVSLTTENANSISSIEKNDFYNVLSEDLLSEEIELSENFSALNFPPENWEVLNIGQNSSWKDTSIFTQEGLQNRVAYFKNNLNGNFDKLITQPIYLDNELSNPYLSFDVSYSSISDSFEDALLVEVSQDCGSTFTDTIYFKSGKFLSTDIQNNSTNSNHHTFRNESVSLKEFLGKRINISFLSNSDGGNNIYIDNVNLTNRSTEDFNPLVFEIFPNPSSGIFNLYFEDFSIENFDLTIVDISGKLILDKDYSFSNGSPRMVSLNLLNISKGVYLLRVNAKDRSIVRRLVISD